VCVYEGVRLCVCNFCSDISPTGGVPIRIIVCPCGVHVCMRACVCMLAHTLPFQAAIPDGSPLIAHTGHSTYTYDTHD
jgi:hypothetical protein